SQMRARVTGNQELSWTIILVAQYLGTDVRWTNEHHEELHLDDLVRYELAAPVETAACGGTHRLFGLSWVYHLHLQKGGKTEGGWKAGGGGEGIGGQAGAFRGPAGRHPDAGRPFLAAAFLGRGHGRGGDPGINPAGALLGGVGVGLAGRQLRAPWVQEAASAL